MIGLERILDRLHHAESQYRQSFGAVFSYSDLGLANTLDPG